MKIKTRIFLTLALLIVVLSAFVLVSSAEESTTTQTVTNVDELNSAISDANVTYIKLGADFTVDEPITVARSGITIDLNGHTITAYESEISANKMLFKLEYQDQNPAMNFTITGSGIFNISRYLYNTNSAKNATVAINASEGGITFISPNEYTGNYFMVGAQGKHTDSLTLTGNINILNPNSKNAVLIYNSSTLNINNSYIKSECEAFISVNGTKESTAPQISFVNTSLHSLGNYIIISTGKYSSLLFENSYIEYSYCAFKENSSTDNYSLNLTMTDTDTKFIGTATSENALLSGKCITATIDGGFHDLNGASLAIGTKYDSENGAGVLIKKGTAITCDFSSYTNVGFENAEVAKWFDSSGKFIAMGYYDSAETAKIDISMLPIVIKDGENYNLKYTSWTGILDNGIYKFTPNENTMEPIASIKGIKYNLSTYTNFNMNIYVPSSIDMVGAYANATCSYSLSGTSYKIGETNYTKYAFKFGASSMDRITMYAKYNVIYNTTVYTLVQKISVSVIDYTEEILNGSEFSEIDKRLAADMLRYCNETIKLYNGSYNTYANEILEKNSDYLTDLNTLVLQNTDTDTSSLSDYLSAAMLLFNAYEPKIAFRYTDKVTSPSASKSAGCIWLSISYTSVDGSLKSAKIEVNTENKIYYTTGISAYDIDELFIVEVYGSESNEPIAKGSFSIATYIKALESTSIDVTFAKVLYAYSLSAEAYKKDI